MRICSITALSKFKNIYVKNRQTLSTCVSLRSKKGTSSNFNEPYSDNDSDDIHLNPTQHRRLLDSPSEFLGDGSQKLLKICVLGIPNAGKSTLVNKLVGGNACPHSKKAHTTRSSSRAVLTEGETQLVFSDTPGVVKPKDVKKFNLESSLVSNPVESAKSADLILVLQGNNNMNLCF